MVTMDQHTFHSDPKKASALCTICKLPKRHSIHVLPHLKGTATPTKIG
jgi:hypothetical protein